MRSQVTDDQGVTREHEAPVEAAREGAVLRFATFELDSAAGELRRAGVRVRIQAQPLKLLRLLASRPYQLVTREEIRRRLWGDDVHVDHEQGINFCVRQVRLALGDEAAAPRFVETVPGEGYRFLADVRTASPGGLSAPAVTPARPRLRPGWVAAAAVGLLLVFSGLWWVESFSLAGKPKGQVEGSALDRPRILVLPFRCLQGDDQGELWGLALTEEVITALGRRHGGALDVLAASTVHRLSETELTPDDLDVDYVVDGALQPGHPLRVTARLVAADGSQLWSTVYDRRSVADLPAIADDVAVAVGLQFRPEGEAGAPLRLSRSGRPRAYAAYVEGRSLLRRWLYRYSPEAEEAVGRARSRLEEALEVDPGFAPPYVELARLHLWRDGVEESESRAREYLERALALDPQMEDAHVLWASLELFWDVDLDGARRAIERALELNPAHAEALEVRATLLVVGGRHDEAVAAVRRYRALAPLSVITAAQAAWHFYFAGRLEEARQAGEDGLALDPRCVGCLRALVLICRQSGELAEATEWARREMALREAGPALASLAATAADPEEALAVYWRWRLDTAPERSSPTVRAEVQMALGNPEAALDLLERAARDREDWRRLYLADDPSFAPLRRDPRFEKVLADLFSARLVVKINRSATIATSR